MADLQSWHQIARSSGYRDEADMLRALYEEKRLSIREISRVVGYSYKTTYDRLIRFGITLRGRGGANHLNKG